VFPAAFNADPRVCTSFPCTRRGVYELSEAGLDYQTALGLDWRQSSFAETGAWRPTRAVAILGISFLVRAAMCPECVKT
jgi:hypothetical protein